MRVVFKIGSNLLRTERGDIDLTFISKIAEGIKDLYGEGHEVLLVSSGAVLCGAKKMGMEEKPADLPMRQALAGIGQAYMMHLYDTIFSNYGIKVAQVLLTNDIFRKGNEDRLSNARNTIECMIKLGVLPIINENDTVAVSELVFGDNDFLSVYVGYAMSADLIVILSTAGGLLDEEGNVVDRVEDMESAFRLVRGTGSDFGSGGMRSKLEATKLALSIGIPVIITGKDEDIRRVVDMETRGTLFLPKKKQVRRRIKSLAMVEEPRGAVIVDEGAVRALRRGGSLLPAGVVKVEGAFRKGDTVSIMNPSGLVVAKGKVNFSSEEIEKIKGMKGEEVKKLLNTTKEEVVHRDDMVVFQ